MSGLTCHRNAAHPPPNNHIPPPPFSPMRSPSASPPPHDIDDNFGGLDINNHDNDDHHGGTLPVDDGQSSPGPPQAIQDGAQILRHPILDGKSLIARYFILSLTESYLGTPCDSLGNDLPPNTPHLKMVVRHAMNGTPSTTVPNSKLPISYIAETRCPERKLMSYLICG